MKIRKSLLAAATAATVSISGVTVAPAFAQEPNTAVEAEESSSAKEFGQELKELSSTDGKWDPKKITLWVGVFTAVLSAVGALLTFLDKHFDVNFK